MAANVACKTYEAAYEEMVAGPASLREGALPVVGTYETLATATFAMS